MRPDPSDDQNRSDFFIEMLDWLKYILIAVLIGLLLVVFVIQRNSVIGTSMQPSLEENDQLLVEKVTKWFNGIDYGDIITISTRDMPLHDGGPNIIKRVVGKPGDTISIHDGGVYRNGEKINEPYLAEGTVTDPRNQSYAEITLKADEYYVLGDNREVSLDSRSFGAVHLDYIIGKVLLRFYPFNELGTP